MSSSLRTLMAGIQITSFIFISLVLQHTHSADNIYSAVMPQTVIALTGSCVQIPCTFTISDFEDKRNRAKSVYGIWLKNKSQFADSDGFIAFNSSENIIRGFSDIQMTGNLNERNCTTVFYNIMKNHSDFYYFRLEMEPNVFRATFNPDPAVSTDSRKTVRITVIDSPQPPEVKPNDQLSVMENTTVNLSCSAEAPCPEQPPTISWSNIPESAHITTQLQEKPDKTQSVFSHVTFKASYMDHKKNISCTATYPRKTSKESTMETNVVLQVLFSPKETHIIITPSASVSVGTYVTLTCKSKASPSNEMIYTWYKREQEMPIAQGKNISFIVTHNDTELYFCIAQNKHGQQSSAEIQLRIKGDSGFSRVIYGCTGGLLAFVMLSAVFFYFMRTKTSSQAHVIRSDQATDRNSDMVGIYANSSITISKKSKKKETDDLHYGEIDFSKLQTDNVTRENSNNDPQTEYAEIQVTGNNKNQKC